MNYFGLIIISFITIIVFLLSLTIFLPNRKDLKEREEREEDEE